MICTDNHHHHEAPREEFDEEGNIVKVGNLCLLGILGEGSFGTVRLATLSEESESDGVEYCQRQHHSYRKFDFYFWSRDNDEEKNNSQDGDNDQLVAVKILSKANLKRRRTIERDKSTRRVKVKTALQQVEREIALMKKLSHPNLVQL